MLEVGNADGATVLLGSLDGVGLGVDPVELLERVALVLDTEEVPTEGL